MKMDKIDLLIIRACKSKEPSIRLRSVFRRFWLTSTSTDQHLAIILSRICDKCVPFGTAELIDELSPFNDWKYSDCDNFYQKSVAVMTSKIRLAKIDRFPGFISPAYFRNKI